MKSDMTTIRIASKFYENRIIFHRRKYNGTISWLDKCGRDEQDFVAYKNKDKALFNFASKLVPLILFNTRGVVLA